MDRLVITLFFCVETFSRGLLLAIIPLDLLAHFGSAQRVTLFYAAVAIFGLGNSMFVPWLLGKLGVRIVVASAGIFMTCAAILLATDSVVGMALGLVVRVLAAACVEIPMTAYIMDRIPRHRLGAFEPVRIFFQGGCIAIAPWLGFQLREYVSAGTPFTVAAIGGVVMLCLALIALPAMQPTLAKPALSRRPTDTILRFFRQPRLRLAWLLALVRSSFWVIFSIYAPIFSVTCGWSPSAAAGTLSLGTASLFFVAIWGRLSRQFGVRRMLIVGHSLAGAFLAATAAAAIWATAIAPLFLLATAFAASIIDGAGNLLFLRATRQHERSAMAGVYMTYRDVSQLAPVAVFAAILTVSPLATAFAIHAMVFMGATRLSQSIHPRFR